MYSVTLHSGCNWFSIWALISMRTSLAGTAKSFTWKLKEGSGNISIKNFFYQQELSNYKLQFDIIVEHNYTPSDIIIFLHQSTNILNTKRFGSYTATFISGTKK